jgi:hypothetical protein
MLFAALWLLTLVVAWKLSGRKRKLQAGAGKGFDIPENETRALSNLEQACRSGDRRQVRIALQRWLREFGPADRYRSLLEFAAGTDDPAIAGAIYALDAEGFQPSNKHENGRVWDGNAFWKQFEAWRSSRRVKHRESLPPLTDLYAKENRRGR